MVKKCDRGLENAVRGRRPRVAFSRPKSQFFTIWTPVNWFVSRIQMFILRNFDIKLGGAPSTVRGLMRNRARRG